MDKIIAAIVFSYMAMTFSAHAALIKVSDGTSISTLDGVNETVFKIDINNYLAGVFNLDVNGVFYDVMFVDGKPSELFVDGLIGASYAEVLPFGEALKTQFFDISIPNYSFNSTNIFGCGDVGLCRITTQYNINFGALRTEINSLGVVFNGLFAFSSFASNGTAIDTTLSYQVVLADWNATPTSRLLPVASTSPTASVPAPSSIILVMIGLFGLVMRKVTK
ncbi:PEP-CTERM sorting domain-containing protein [Rheinheimera sp. UJ51]|uniref:PEP-CTERM sorting domain-containing protein n=1 Tax=Rheinheimera sp. UJ51 TaxID=2892446 RepID=UPI001E58D0BE|nr:PEP-CTERM sorting domain-containing protein [Rheinheimera sp. UJ51]MCC5450591.1 PEP-CTERM sorting domain-containing protein [Rheinheimera sp. UJ51]